MIRWFRNLFSWMATPSYHDLAVRLAVAENRISNEIARAEELRAQLMHLRVEGATEGRVGWEVCAFIPEGVIKSLKTKPPAHYAEFVKMVADVLVYRAIHGLTRFNRSGKVRALLFAEPDPIGAPGQFEAFDALWDDRGDYKMDSQLWDRRPDIKKIRGW